MCLFKNGFIKLNTSRRLQQHGECPYFLGAWENSEGIKKRGGGDGEWVQTWKGTEITGLNNCD